MKKNLLFLIAGILSSALVYAQPAGWSYAKSIRVANTSTTAAINYQLKITINTQALITATQMLATGADIRFGKTCNGSTLYNYWIENGINTPTTNIWVKIDTIPANGSRTFFIFHGNATVTPVSAVPGVFVGPHSATDSVATGGSGGATNSQRAFRFTPTEDLLVTHFGKREPNGTPREVTLFDFTTQALLTQFTVTGAAAQYNYGALPNPVWLTNATQYVLSLYQGPTDGYYFGSSSQIGQHMTYGDMRYCNSCLSTTYPTNVLTNYHYGYPDLWYFTKTTITPAPTYTYNAATTISSVVATSSAVCASSTVGLNASNATSGLTYSWIPNGVSGASITVSPTATTVYTLITTQVGCSLPYNNVTTTVAINAAPIVTVNSGTICQGQSFTITATGASTYVYQGGSSVITPTANTTVSVTGTGTNGCVSSVVNSSITVNPLPNVTASNSPSLICAGSAATLAAAGATTYSWNTGPVTAIVVVSPTITTTYTVTGTSNTCAKTVTVTQNVSACTGINNLSSNISNSTFLVYPNPNNGVFTLELTTASLVKITNLLGEVIQQQNLEVGNHAINLSKQANGIYFIKSIANGKEQTIKVIKE